MEPEHHIKLKEDISPKVHPPRKIPANLQEMIKEELDNMEKTGVIRKINEPTEWVNSMVVVEKASGGLRICLDPGDLNKAIKKEYYQLPTFKEIASRLSGAKLFMKLNANKGCWRTLLDKAPDRRHSTHHLEGISSQGCHMECIQHKKFSTRRSIKVLMAYHN